MSSKSSLFLTKDNEHFYEECKSAHYEKIGNESFFKGFTIVLEMSKKNIEILLNDDEDLIIELKPGSELYKYMMKMRD